MSSTINGSIATNAYGNAAGRSLLCYSDAAAAAAATLTQRLESQKNDSFDRRLHLPIKYAFYEFSDCSQRL
jgi:hypothetical protein